MSGRIIMHTPEPGSGAALYVAELVKALAGAGERVVLFCPRNFVYLQEVEQSGASVVCAGSRGAGPGGLVARLARNLRFLAGSFLSQLALTRSGDIVHFQFPLYFPAGLVFFVLARLQARAIVYTAHDPIPHKWLLPGRLQKLEKACLSGAYALSDRVLVHNPGARDLLVRTFAMDPGKIAVIPHGCSNRCSGSGSERRQGAALDPAPGTLDLLTFGSIREDKGLDLAIEAVQSENATGIKVNLVIAGAVANAREQAYWDTCKELIERAPAGIFIMERFIPDDEVAALLARCDAVLLPYRNFESDSGVAALAIASARPILATDRGSFAVLLKAADLGIPIHSPSASSIAQAIRLAVSIGPGELREKGLRGMAFAQSSRSWNAIGKKTINVYEELQALPIRPIREPRHG